MIRSTIPTVLMLMHVWAMPAFGQSIDQALAKMQNGEWSTRMDGFYELAEEVPLHEQTAAPIRSAVIALLIREGQEDVEESDAEAFSDYVADLVIATTSLRDIRAVQPLLRWLPSGIAAIDAVAAFGPASLDAVIAMTRDSREIYRSAAGRTLLRMLQLPAVTDAASLAKIRKTLTALALDPYVGARTIAAKGLAVLFNVPLKEPIRLVNVDVKPGDSRNSINLRSRGVVPVAILSTPEFDATTLLESSPTFGPGKATEVHGGGHIEHVDADGRLDVVLHFEIEETGLLCGDSSVFILADGPGPSTAIGVDRVSLLRCQ